jgi:hypothetical protein
MGAPAKSAKRRRLFFGYTMVHTGNKIKDIASRKRSLTEKLTLP